MLLADLPPASLYLVPALLNLLEKGSAYLAKQLNFAMDGALMGELLDFVSGA